MDWSPTCIASGKKKGEVVLEDTVGAIDPVPMSELVLSQLRGTRMVAPGVMTDRRQGPDRRRVSFWSIAYGGFRPRRRHHRRLTDHALPLVDWHESHLLAVSIGILLLCFADAFLTLNLLFLGAREANPFMAAMVLHGIRTFTIVKMALTGTGVLLLVCVSRFRLFGRIKVEVALYGIFICYVALILYQLLLFSAVP